jgi:hypothetical protein
MNKLVIAPCGNDDTFIKNWVKGKPEFDLLLLYYGDNLEIAKTYLKLTPNVYYAKGEKYHLIKSIFTSHKELLEKYEYFWLPDDDILLETEQINKLFRLSNQYSLQICQPSVVGHISHNITKPIENVVLRYTNFVEVMAPLFNRETFIKLSETFNYNQSAWGYDYLWPHLLGYPKDKIAIIDDIVMEHTKPVGSEYSKERFPIEPWDELVYILSKYSIKKEEIEYSRITK